MTSRVFNSSISNLPVPVKTMGDMKVDQMGDLKIENKGPRKVLGDITSTQGNKDQIAIKDISKRVTRLGCRRSLRCAKIEQATEVLTEPECDRVLPPGVVDIDSKDSDNPQLCSEYVLETFAYLRTLEGKAQVRVNHLAGLPTNDKMRAVLVDWLVEVQTQFKLLQETLHSTVNIIDRYMEVEGNTVSRAKLQLVGVAAMFLASKIEEMYAPACSDFVYITDNAYSEAEIRATELKIVKALQFNLSQPVSLNFLRRFSKAGDVDVLQHSLAKYSLEVCLLDYTLVSVPGSRLAAASLCLSLLVLDPANNVDTVWTPTLRFYSGYQVSELLPIVKKIATNLLRIARSTKLQAVRIKYKSGKFLKVADLGELKGEVITNLANC